MCDPRMFLIASGVQAGGQIAGGFETKRLADWEASQLEADAAVRAAKIRKAGKLTQGTARSGYAASGVDVGTGTPAEVDRIIARNVEQDALTELLYGKRRADALRTAGKTAVTSSLIGGAGSVLSSAATYNALNRGWIQKAAPIEERSLYDVRIK